MVGPIIRTEALTRDFKSTRAVDSLSIEVPRGIVFGFLGPNGSGKTTTIRMLLGLLEPTSGNAVVLGFDTIQCPNDIRSRCGALLEHPGLYERLSAEDNLQLYARIWGMRDGGGGARIREVLESFGLWDRRKDPAGTFSHGMKKKLAVARAMLHRPALLFLDEPTAGMDAVAAAGLRDDLAGIVRREGITVFLTTHNLPEAEKICSRVAVIREGRLLAEGPPNELRSRKEQNRVEIKGSGFTDGLLEKLRADPQVRRAAAANGTLVLDLQDSSRIAPLVRRLVEAGVELEEVRKGNASLEDAFLSLVEDDRSA
jgi:ABC-2 type transport system ATP-binding protein